MLEVDGVEEEDKNNEEYKLETALPAFPEPSPLLLEGPAAKYEDSAALLSGDDADAEKEEMATSSGSY